MTGDESKKLAIHSINFSCSSSKQCFINFAVAVAIAKRWKMTNIVAIALGFEMVEARLRAAQRAFFLPTVVQYYYTIIPYEYPLQYVLPKAVFRTPECRTNSTLRSVHSVLDLRLTKLY